METHCVTGDTLSMVTHPLTGDSRCLSGDTLCHRRLCQWRHALSLETHNVSQETHAVSLETHCITGDTHWHTRITLLSMTYHLNRHDLLLLPDCNLLTWKFWSPNFIEMDVKLIVCHKKCISISVDYKHQKFYTLVENELLLMCESLDTLISRLCQVQISVKVLKGGTRSYHFLIISARVACYISGSTCITIHVKLPSPARIHSHRIDIVIYCSTVPCSSFWNYLNIARDPIPGCRIPFLSNVTGTR